MKSTIHLVRRASYCLATAAALLAQTPCAVSQNISFTYAAPKDAMALSFGRQAVYSLVRKIGADEEQVLEGYRFADLKDEASITTFRQLVPPHLLATYDSLTAESSVHRRAIEMLGGGNADLNVYLVDDRNGLPYMPTYFLPGYDKAHERNHIRPTVRVRKPDNGNRLVNEVALGEMSAAGIAGDAGGSTSWEATIISGISLALLLRGSAHPYDLGEGFWVPYSPEATDLGSDMWYDQETALQFGLAGFFGFAYNSPAAENLIAFGNRTEAHFAVKSTDRTAKDPMIWDAPHTLDPRVAEAVKDLPENERWELRRYRWLDLPGSYVLYNDTMNAAYFLLFWKYGTRERATALTIIDKAAAAIGSKNADQHPAFVANHLAGALEAYATTENGKADASTGQLRSGMFAYGLFDLITHFGMDKAALETLMTNHWKPGKPQSLSPYLDHRDAVKSQVEPYLTGSKIDIEKATQELAAYFTKTNSNPR